LKTIALHLTIAEESKQLGISMIIKSNTFLKIAGIIQRTQYKEIEAETLSVWQELLE
jgi:hypothetical protein